MMGLAKIALGVLRCPAFYNEDDSESAIKVRVALMRSCL